MKPKNSIIPLAVPPKLNEQIVATAKETGLSMADVMRQSMIIGLPRLLDYIRKARR